MPLTKLLCTILNVYRFVYCVCVCVCVCHLVQLVSTTHYDLLHAAPQGDSTANSSSDSL